VAGTPEIDEREQAASLARIENGELPLVAERRMKGLRDAGGRGFTSDLSVAEFALGHEVGLEPLSQVMGSCIYQVGWQYGYGGGYSADGSLFEELSVLTGAWNEARSRALHRMAQEASLAGGNVVVGVDLRRGEHDWAEGAVEFVVFGTAVRDPQITARWVVLTDLSVQDYWKLRRAGIEPCGLVASSSCFFIRRGMVAQSSQLLNFAANEEIPEYTRGLYAARETALGRLTHQARELGAEGVVGVNIEHTIGMQEVTMGIGRERGLMVTLHVTGTAVGGTAGAHPPTPDLQVRLNETRTSP
jgi:uncharacterized protein YbjQ (UPF0145 family)